MGGIRNLQNLEMNSGAGRAYQSYLTGSNSKTPKEVYTRNQGGLGPNTQQQSINPDS